MISLGQIQPTKACFSPVPGIGFSSSEQAASDLIEYSEEKIFQREAPVWQPGCLFVRVALRRFFPPASREL
jgi:hypothetical protein